MENNEEKVTPEVKEAPAGPTAEELRQQLEAVKAEKEQLLTTQDEISKLQAELEKQKAELEELKRYKYPEQATPVVNVESLYEQDMQSLKTKFDNVIWSVEHGVEEGNKTREIFRPKDAYNGYSLNDGYLDYKALDPEDRTLENLKKIFPKIF